LVDQIKKNELGRACGTYGGEETYRGLVGKREGKGSLGRHNRTWEDNIKMHLEEVGWGAWIGLGWPRIETGGGFL